MPAPHTPRNLDLASMAARVADAARDAATLVQREVVQAGAAVNTITTRAVASAEHVVVDRIKARVGPPIIGAIAQASLALLVALIALYRTRRGSS